MKQCLERKPSFRHWLQAHTVILSVSCNSSRLFSVSPHPDGAANIAEDGALSGPQRGLAVRQASRSPASRRPETPFGSHVAQLGTRSLAIVSLYWAHANPALAAPPADPSVQSGTTTMKRVLLFVLLGALAALAARDKCGPCDPDACRTPDSCLAGLVKDACGCCMVCGQREGHRCYHRSVAGSWEHGPCGEDLDCRPRADLAPGDPAEALCVCNKAWPMCGSDGVTYDSVCQLTEARYSRRDGLEAASRGPCMAGEVHLVEERACGEKPFTKRFVSVKRRTIHFHI